MPRTLPDTMPPHVRAALREAKARLEALYGERLARVVLYGSHARGEARADSDVDLLVVLHGGVDVLAELRRLAPLTLDLLGRFGAVLTVYPTTPAGYEDRARPLMAHVHVEGVPL